MKRRRKLNREQLVFLALTAAVFLCLCLGRAKVLAAAAGREGDAHQLTLYDTRYNEGPLRVGYFEIDGGTVAMCVCHELDPPSQPGTPLVTNAVYTAENKGNELMRKIYFYGWQGPADVGASFVETCLAGSVANGHDDNFYGYGQAFIDRIAGLPAAPNGFAVYVLSDGSRGKQDLAYWEYQPVGRLRLKKSNTQAKVAEGNDCYSLRGAQYGVFSEEACVNEKAVLTTDGNGSTEETELDSGTYYVKEVKAPKGYRLDPNVYPVAVGAEETKNIEVGELPVWDPLGLTIEKRDAQSGEGRPLGGASLEGAEFRVRYYKGYYTEENLPNKPDREWLLATKAEEVSGEIRYLCKLDKAYLRGGDTLFEVDGQPVLPLGTVTVEETKAPKGYLKEGVTFRDGAGQIAGERYLAAIRQKGDAAAVEGGNVCVASNYVIRGDLELVKIAGGTHKRLAGVPFQITSMTSGESHILVTDENGQASTEAGWNLHTERTNLGESPDDGVWFGVRADSTSVEPEDTRGALPFDIYQIEELRCESNQEYELIPPFAVTISKDKRTVRLGTLTNSGIPEEPEEPQEPEEQNDLEDPKEPEEPEKIEEPKEPIEPKIEEPEEPKEPEKIEEPKEPEKPEEAPAPKSRAGKKPPAARTGDEANVIIPLFASILSCAAAICCVMIAHRVKKSKRRRIHHGNDNDAEDSGGSRRIRARRGRAANHGKARCGDGE